MFLTEVTTKIWKERGMYVSYCPKLDVASCGHTQEEARRNLAEVIRIQEVEMKRLGILQDLADHYGTSDDEK